MKNKFKVVVAVVLSAIVICGAVLSGMNIARIVKAASVEELAYDGERMNVVFMIGDGMGFNHMAAAESRYGDLFMKTAPVSGSVTTYSMNIFGPTDSAAAASALATGEKVNNGNVARYLGKDRQSVTEIAMGLGMSAGIIATEGVDGATPAGFSAHVNARQDIEGILEDQLASGIDLFIGSNIERYAPLKDKISQNYIFADSVSSLLSAPEGKVFASFEEIPLEGDNDKKPELADLAVYAMNRLSADEDGFFLMIEESHIDKCSHNNDIQGATDHVKAYDNAVRAVVEAAGEIGNTLVIITADHETGGLQYNGESAQELSDDMYTLTHHSGADVPYFIFGDLACDMPEKVDNTQLARLVMSILRAA